MLLSATPSSLSSPSSFGWRRSHKNRERASWHRTLKLGQDVQVAPELLGRLLSTGDKQRKILRAVEKARSAERAFSPNDLKQHREDFLALEERKRELLKAAAPGALQLTRDPIRRTLASLRRTGDPKQSGFHVWNVGALQRLIGLSGVTHLIHQANQVIGTDLANKPGSHVQTLFPRMLYTVGEKIDPHNHEKSHLCLYYPWPQPWQPVVDKGNPSAPPQINVPIVVDHVAMKHALDSTVRRNISRVRGKPDEINYFLNTSALPQMGPFSIVTIRPQNMTGGHAVFINDNIDWGVLHGSTTVAIPSTFKPTHNPLGISPQDMAHAYDFRLGEITLAAEPERMFHFSSSALMKDSV